LNKVLAGLVSFGIRIWVIARLTHLDSVIEICRVPQISIY